MVRPLCQRVIGGLGATVQAGTTRAEEASGLMRPAYVLHFVFFASLGCLGNIAWITFADAHDFAFAVSVLTSLVRTAIAFAMVGFVAGVVAALLHGRTSGYRYTRRASPIVWGPVASLVCAVPGAFVGIAVVWIEFGFLRLLPRLAPGLMLGACVGALVSLATWHWSRSRDHRLA